MKKIIFGALLVGAAVVATTTSVSAHRATSFEPGPGCMGKITSFHAQDPDHGLRHNYENWNDGEGMPHTGIANRMDAEPAENFQEFMKLNKAWCKSYME